MLCISAALKAQTDTVSYKISKIPYTRVDVLAKFPGGDFSKYIAANIDYQKKVDKNIHGLVIVSMKIDSAGRVADVNILKSMSPDVDAEVVHVIKTSPKWKPAMLNNKPVPMYMVFNIDMGIRGTGPASPPKTPVPVVPLTSKPVTVPPANVKTLPPVEKKPVPVSAKKTVPIEKKPAIKAVKRPVPPYDKKPAMPIEKKPAPQIVKKPTPPVVKKPAPHIAKKIAPPAVKKAAPPVEKKPIPQVVKKPILPVEKKPVRQVTKIVTPPVSQVAKKVAPPPVKKQKPVIVRKPKLPPPEKQEILGRSANAEFPGGRQAFYQYLSENIHYPPVSKINKIEGAVSLTFVVDKNGYITNVKVLNAPAEDLAEEATRVLLASPKWKPGMQNGMLINEQFTVPINFKLKDSQNPPPQQ